MFTGIVQKVEKGFLEGNYLKFPRTWDIELGESVSVNGVCLTVMKLNRDFYYFELGEITKRTTNLSKAKLFNLEKALKVGDRLNGHFVTGHVDGMIRITRIEKTGNTAYFHFQIPEETWAIVEKGSIALNGISLTIAGKSLDTFFVQVIPHTYETTNLRFLKPGDMVNYEIDIFARYLKESRRWIK